MAELFGFEEFLRLLGVDLQQDANSLVLTAASYMFTAELPPEWSEYHDASTLRSFFYNELTGQSSWTHPQEATFQELICEVRCWQSHDSVEHVCARSKAHLETVRRRWLDSLKCWAEANINNPEEDGVESPSSHYYYNKATGESNWIDPRLSMEFDLIQRSDILRECIAEHTEIFPRLAWECSSGDEEAEWDEETVAGHCSAVPAALPHLLRAQPSKTVSFSDAVQLSKHKVPPSHVPLGGAGDESVKSSCTSYHSACSDNSDSEEVSEEPDHDDELSAARSRRCTMLKSGSGFRSAFD